MQNQKLFGLTLFTYDSTWFPEYGSRAIITERDGSNPVSGVFTGISDNMMSFRMDIGGWYKIAIPKSPEQLVLDGLQWQFAEKVAELSCRMYIDKK